MNFDRVETIEKEFAAIGLWKIDGAVRKTAARVLAGELKPGPGATEGNLAAVEDVISLYRTIKQEEFLKNDFDRLEADEKYLWLKNTVEKKEKLNNIDFHAAYSGRENFAVRALVKAYKDKSKNIHDYAAEKLRTIVLTDKSSLITEDRIPRFIDELIYLHEVPQPYSITKEKFRETATTVTSFFFNWGGNIYVIAYQKNGRETYTLIDTGERRNKPTILKLFKDNGIEPANIERILLTHHHFDHSGMVDVLCMVSDARVLVHPDFKGDSIELDMSRFGKYIEWLPAARPERIRTIGGIPFSILGEPLDIGEGAKLEVLGLPEGDQITHTVDQLLFLYTPKNSPETLARIGRSFRPTDETLFSGDLWLVQPPGFFENVLRGLLTAELHQETRRLFDFRPQNRREKDALKTGFSVITVKPGHGPEFLGTRMLGTLLSRRDLMVKLGFDENDKKEKLNEPKFAAPIRQLQANADRNFTEEIKLWLKPLDEKGFGYNVDDVAGFLLRAFREQTGGGEIVRQDRLERRIDLKRKLIAIQSDRLQPDELQSVARAALALIEKVP